GKAEGRSSVNVRLRRDRRAPRNALEECGAQLWLTSHAFTTPGGCMGSFPKVHSQRLSEATSVCVASQHGIAAPKGLSMLLPKTPPCPSLQSEPALSLRSSAGAATRSAPCQFVGARGCPSTHASPHHAADRLFAAIARKDADHLTRNLACCEARRAVPQNRRGSLRDDKPLAASLV